MHSKSQEDANWGCSCTKYRPSDIWSWYSCVTNSMCSQASLYARRRVAGFARVAFSRCHVEKAVHIGEPMRSIGLLRCNSLRALILFAGTVKSHGCPSSGSFTVRSSASPGLRCAGRVLAIS